MNVKRLMTSAAATVMFWTGLAGSPGASCGDRPGTPDMVNAVARDSRDADGRPQREIVFSWRNTASNGERVWWDVEITNGAGAVVGSTTGGLRSTDARHAELFNAYLLGPRTTRCYRIRARTGPGTSGCVSALWSARVCATTSRAIGTPPR